MDWYSGTITESITAAKNINAIFVVYIYDKTEISENTKKVLNDEEILKNLNVETFVSIQIENGSQDAIQFAQIYPLLMVPALFFINPQNGLPLEVMAGNFEAKELKEKLSKIASLKESKQEVKEAGEEPKSDTVESFELAHLETAEPCSLQSLEASELRECSSAASELRECSSAASECESNAGLSTRVDHANEVIAQRQQDKRKQEMEEEKRREIERRRMPESVAKAKERATDQDRLDAANQRRKDKQDDVDARQRVKDQIAADRAERQVRTSILRGAADNDEVKATPAPQRNAESAAPTEMRRDGRARLKFRFPDNSSSLSEFASATPLSAVVLHLRTQCPSAPSRFRLVATLPPRAFGDEHMHMTVAELALVPSAIIIVKPVLTKSLATMVSSWNVSAILWSLLSPVTHLLAYLRVFFGSNEGGGGGAVSASAASSDEDERQSAKRPRTEGSQTTRHRPKTAAPEGRVGRLARREGNVHRLAHGSDSDSDDTNTWNGNSTQQM